MEEKKRRVNSTRGEEKEDEGTEHEKENLLLHSLFFKSHSKVITKKGNKHPSFDRTISLWMDEGKKWGKEKQEGKKMNEWPTSRHCIWMNSAALPSSSFGQIPCSFFFSSCCYFYWCCSSHISLSHPEPPLPSLHINGNKENILEGDADDDDNDISRREGRTHSRESLRNHLVMQRVSLVIRDAFDLSCSREMNIITRNMTDAAKVTVMLTLSSLMFLINLPEQELCS